MRGSTRSAPGIPGTRWPSHRRISSTRGAISLRVYGSQLWLDPGEPAVQDRVMRVVSDIVQRYDIDGFMPTTTSTRIRKTTLRARLIDFPDSGSYARSGSTLSRADWRRANVDRFVERLYREVHALKPTIKVGISPFGIWRPGNPASVNGLDAYATIYADSRKWLQQGWVDYLAPQLYWAIGATQQSYPGSARLVDRAELRWPSRLAWARRLSRWPTARRARSPRRRFQIRSA